MYKTDVVNRINKINRNYSDKKSYNKNILQSIPEQNFFKKCSILNRNNNRLLDFSYLINEEY